VLRAKVCLCELLAFRIKLDCRVVTAKFFVLFTYSQVAHNHNCDKIVQLKAKIFLHFVILLDGWFAVLLLYFLAKLIASQFSKL